MRQQEPPTVSTAELRNLLAARTASWLVYAPDHAGFTEGHIPGSLSATDAQVLAALPQDADVVIYGEHPGAGRAMALAVTLRATGRSVRWYEGGLAAWAAAGLAVETAPERGGGP